MLWVRIALAASLPLVVLTSVADAHRSGCHRWHSCPSDTGSSVCGDLGYCSQCPDKEYCVAGRPRAQPQQPQAQSREAPSGQFGVPPDSAWTCPATHPIKGNFTTYSGERCIYHMPGGQFYDKTKPERCYATEEEARKDGCRRSKR